MKVSKFVFIFGAVVFSLHAHAGTKKSAKPEGLSLECGEGISFSGVSAKAPQVTFTEKGDSTPAKLGAMEECKANAGKFFCYHANSETMINIPLDIDAKHSGDKVTISINDDADDVTGNGKAYTCAVK